MTGSRWRDDPAQVQVVPLLSWPEPLAIRGPRLRPRTAAGGRSRRGCAILRGIREATERTTASAGAEPAVALGRLRYGLCAPLRYHSRVPYMRVFGSRWPDGLLAVRG